MLALRDTFFVLWCRGERISGGGGQESEFLRYQNMAQEAPGDPAAGQVSMPGLQTLRKNNLGNLCTPYKNAGGVSGAVAY